MSARSRAPGEARIADGVASPAVESRGRRWRRRAVSCSAVTVATVVVWGALPLLLPCALIVDLASGRRLSVGRALLFMAWYLACESVGVVVSAGLSVRHSISRPQEPVWWRWNQALQSSWTRALWWAAVRIFRLSVDVKGADDCARGPIIVLSRHTSLADTLLPAVFIAAAHQMLLSTVMKQELLWDPCLDIVGQRLPNAFVLRGGKDSAAEIEKVRALARGLVSVDDDGAHRGVLIYPEGTRFSAARLSSAQQRLASHSDPRVATAAAALTHVLPLQLGGVTAALAAAPNADVVICAHVGFDGIRTFSDLVRGSLVGRHIRLNVTRVSRAEVPAEPSAQVGWLLEQWADLDRWVAQANP